MLFFVLSIFFCSFVTHSRPSCLASHALKITWVIGLLKSGCFFFCRLNVSINSSRATFIGDMASFFRCSSECIKIPQGHLHVVLAFVMSVSGWVPILKRKNAIVNRLMHTGTMCCNYSYEAICLCKNLHERLFDNFFFRLVCGTFGWNILDVSSQVFLTATILHGVLGCPRWHLFFFLFTFQK